MSEKSRDSLFMEPVVSPSSSTEMSLKVDILLLSHLVCNGERICELSVLLYF